MSAPSNAAEKSALNVPEPSQEDVVDDSPKKWETKEPGSLPARNSSLPKPRKSPGVANEKMDAPKEGVEDIVKDSPAPTVEKPPTPPPKNPPSKSRARKANVPVSKPSPPPPKKKGIVEQFMDVLASCCSPSEPKKHDQTRTNRKEPRRKPKHVMEMDSLRKENDIPTLSTIGIPSVYEESQAPPVPSKKRDATAPAAEETKPSVTIAPEANLDKETNGQPRILTPPLQPTSEESTDEELGTISTDDGRDRQLRDSLQIQAPFPPTSDEVPSEAVVVAPSPQISIQNSSDPEDSEPEEVPRPININIDEPQPRVVFPRFQS